MPESKCTVGYFIPEFPQQTHIFFWREMQVLNSLGMQVEIFSTRKADTTKVKHAFVSEIADRVSYLHPPHFFFFLHAALAPLWCVQAIRYLIALKCPLSAKLKCLYFIPLSAGLLKLCKQQGIRHVHGHSCANVGHILAIAQLSGQISYSLTLHGSLQTYGEDHDVKMRNASFVSAVTRPLQQDVMVLTGLPRDKVPHITMGVDLDKFRPHKRKRGYACSIAFVSVARLAVGKGHRFAFEALARLKADNVDFSYTVIGSGPDEAAIREAVVVHGLESEVTFTGSLGEDEIRQALQQADVLLLTSLGTFEAAPVCVMEAMASGIPTITSIIGGTPDMITDGVDGFLVEQQSVDQIEVAMRRFIANPNLLDSMGEAARMTAERLFDHRIQARRLYTCITEASA